MEKELDVAEHPRSLYYYTPYIDVELQFDPLQADPLLQKSLVLDDSNDTDSDNNYSDHLGTDGAYTDDNRQVKSFSMTTPTTTNTTASNASFVNRNHNLNQHKRKLSLTELSSNAVSSDASSGRFDDADESDIDVDDEVEQEEEEQQHGEKKNCDETHSIHSAKRGRSNGWPLQSEIAYDENGMTIDLSGRRNTPSPTPTKGKINNMLCAKQSPVLRIRRSRFVEGSMNDRVSEKPPSILFQDDHSQSRNGDTGLSNPEPTAEEKKNLEKRSSGIFRFGKALASAFHPFASKGNNNRSEIWKSSAQQDNSVKSQKEIMKQRQIRAEKAYAELKKSGYKGTVAGSGNLNGGDNNNKVDASVADETWKAIQEKMDYGLKMPDANRTAQDDSLFVASGNRDDVHSHLYPENGVSKLKSFSELRKRASNLNIPSIRFRDVSPIGVSAFSDRGEDTDQDHQQVYSHNSYRSMERRQSRKELNKQAKLLKRVSNLEDKLERARRELREYGVVSDNNYNNTNHDKLQPPMPAIPTICVDDEHGRRFGPGTLPTLLSERLLDNSGNNDNNQPVQHGTSRKPANWPPVDSLSRKTKSRVATTGENAVDMTPNNNDNEYDNKDDDNDNDYANYDTDYEKTSNDNKNNKSNMNKSPGAMANDPQTEKRTRNKLRSVRDKRASSLTTKASQRLKAKQSSRNLSSTTTAISKISGKLQENNNEKISIPQLQEQEGNVSTTPTPTPSASASSSPKKKGTWTYYSGGTGDGSDDVENIPPVPPVPKELSSLGGNGANSNYSNATKLATAELIKRSISKQRVPSKEFSWPEDIF